MRKSLLALAILAAAAVPLSAQAGPVQPFTISNGVAPIQIGANALDWNEAGSGVAIGVGPFGTPLQVGQEFVFKYQANLSSISGGTPTLLALGLDPTSNGSGDLGRSYEFTIVASFREVVTAVGVNTAGQPNATFGLAGTPEINKVAIYYDTAMNANTLLGTGFDDGTKVAQFTITPGDAEFATASTFQQTSPTTGQGAAKIHAVLSGGGDFVDPLYLQGIESLIFGMHFQSNLNVPAGTSSTGAFHLAGDAFFPDYVVGSSDIVFKVDGSNEFTSAVPEPGTLALLGLGLLGFGARRLVRGNSKAAA